MISKKNGLAFAIVFGLLLAGWCPPVWADLTDNLLAYWRLDETQGLVAEDSFAAHDGSLTNGPAWTASPAGGAIVLDGTDDYILVPAGSGSDFDFGPDLFTLSVWFKTTADSDQTLLASPGKSPNPGDYYRLDILSSGRVRFEYATYDVQTMISPLAYNDGLWHHVAAVRNDVKMGKVYVDGVLVAEDTDNTGGIFTGIQANDNLYIGCYKPANSHFQGALDEVLVYRRALSQDEVMQLFHTGLAAMVSLEILGPDQVAENSSASYKAIAHYDDGSTSDVTSSALWTVDPAGFASINSSGLLTTADIEKFQNLTLTASYTRQGITVEDFKAITIFAVCPSGFALQFDGVNDYVFIPANVSETKYTLSLWFRTTDPYAGIIGISKGWESYDREIFLSNGNLCARLWQEQTIKTTGQNYADGQWHHVTHVYGTDVGGQKLYVDGKEMASGSKSSSNFDFETEIKVGWAKSAVNDYFKGFIDELRVWNRALTLEEIKESMHIPLSLESPELYGYWNFDEGNGQVVHVISGNGQDGYLGSNPNPDDNDPQWVASDAPVGICTPYIIAVQNIQSALKKKLKTLEAIDAALENEQKSLDALRDLMQDSDPANPPKIDILKSMADIRLAMVQQKVAQLALRKSVQKLEDALRRLGVSAPAHQWPDVPPSKSCNPADINQDGCVNTADLLLLRQNWMKTE